MSPLMINYALPRRFGPLTMLIRLPVLALFLLPVLRASAPDELIRQAVVAEARQDSRAALDLYLRADKISPDTPDILQKIARQYSDLVAAQSGTEAKKHYAEIALQYAQRAVALDPENAVNVLSVAVCHGKLALYSDIRDKVKYSRLLSEETKHALALDPNYAWAHHVLGRWNCEVAAVGTTSRLFAKLFYGDLPDASFAEGIRQLQLATELEPQEVSHWLELGFAYRAAGKTAEARAQWTHCLSMHSRGTYDDAAMKNARDELAKLK